MAYFKAALRLRADLEPILFDSDSLERIQEDFIVEPPYSDKVMPRPTSLFPVLSDYPEFDGFEYSRYSNNNGIIYVIEF